MLLHRCRRQEVSGFLGAADVRDSGTQKSSGDSGDRGAGTEVGVCGPWLGHRSTSGIERTASGSFAQRTGEVFLYDFGNGSERSGFQDRADGDREDEDYFAVSVVSRVND